MSVRKGTGSIGAQETHQHSGTLFHSVAEEDIRLLARENPLFVQLKIAIGGWNQPEYFAPSQDMIPHGSAAKINVEIGIAVLHRHEAVLLHLWVHHAAQQVGALPLGVLQLLGPHHVHPVDLAHDLRTLDEPVQAGV